MKNIEEYVRSIPDFPKKGINFRDVTTVIGDTDGFRLAIDKYQEILKDIEFDCVAGLEARGFIFGAPIAYNMNKKFVPIRKKGKLPWKTISQEYSLEYGTAELEMHIDSIEKGQKVVIVDDLIATGGSVEAAIKLIEQLGGEVVACVFLIELKGLEGRKKLSGYKVESIITYEGA